MTDRRPGSPQVEHERGPVDPRGFAVGRRTAPTDAAVDRALDETPYWPVTRLAGWSLTLLLGVGILAPEAVARPSGTEWLALLVPAIVTTLGARALFEALGFAAGSRRVTGHAAAALPPAILAALMMAGASAIIGVHWFPLTGVLTTAGTMSTFAIAGAVRGVEIRIRLSMRRVYLIGSPDSERDLARELTLHNDARLVGAMTAVEADPPLDTERVVRAVLATRATVLVLDGSAMRVLELVEAAGRLNLAGLHVRDLVSYYEDEFKKVPLVELTQTWFLFDIASIHRQGIWPLLRRAADLVLAVALLVLTLPLVAIAVALIKLTSHGPALYRQRRVGRAGVEFTLLKLRTMAENGERDGLAAWAAAHAHRVTPVGGLLRRFHLDELPQLWNVIRGDLALIGPRPEQVPIAARLGRELPHYASRHCIRPGLTGWAQVQLGYSGSVEGTTAKLQRDLYYVKHQSLRLDALIILLTLRAVLAGRG